MRKRPQPLRPLHTATLGPRKWRRTGDADHVGPKRKHTKNGAARAGLRYDYILFCVNPPPSPTFFAPNLILGGFHLPDTPGGSPPNSFAKGPDAPPPPATATHRAVKAYWCKLWGWTSRLVLGKVRGRVSMGPLEDGLRGPRPHTEWGRLSVHGSLGPSMHILPFNL